MSFPRETPNFNTNQSHGTGGVKIDIGEAN